MKELKAGSWKDMCTPMFTEPLFTTAKQWKQPKCSSTEEWINKGQYIRAMEYYSAIKTEGILIHATKWMNLEDTMLSKISQSKEDK